MPFDSAHPVAVEAAELHGVKRHILARHALDQLSPGLRAAVAGFELAEAGDFVNMGLNFGRVSWRALWHRPGLPDIAGTIPVWRGEIA